MRKGFLAAAGVVLATMGMSRAGDQIRLKSRQFVPEKGISPEAKARIEGARGGRMWISDYEDAQRQYGIRVYRRMRIYLYSAV